MDIQDLYDIFLTCRKVNIDTRTIQENDLFFGINGENFNGNKFANIALEKGALVAVIDDPEYMTDNCILVDDSILTLQSLAKYHRNQLNTQILALTGSNGKTTTKELIAALLGQKYTVQYTQGNLNNHLGVPLTLLDFKNDTEIGIVEMGANHVNEIKELCEIALPECGLITNIGKAHIGEFGSYENIIKAKTELYDFIESTDGIIFYNEKSEVLVNRIANYESSISYASVTVGDYAIKFSKIEPTISLFLGEPQNDNAIQINTPLGGGHNCENIIAAVVVASFFGLEPKQIKSALEKFIIPSNRSQWINTQHNQVFLDAYNANPTSMAESIKYFNKIEGNKKCFIIGEMLELGEYADEEHANLIEILQKTGNKYVLLGDNFAQVAPDNSYYATKSQLIESGLLNQLKGYKVLIKASRGMALEKLIEYL